MNALEAAALIGGGEGISTARKDKEALIILTDSGKIRCHSSDRQVLRIVDFCFCGRQVVICSVRIRSE